MPRAEWRVSSSPFRYRLFAGDSRADRIRSTLIAPAPRACPGGTRVCTPERGLSRRSPPPGSSRWSDGFCTSDGWRRVPSPPGLPRWSGVLCTRRGRALGRPHRARPGGAEVFAPERGGRRSAPLYTSPRSTGASPVGAGEGRARPSCAEAVAPPGRARWGRRRRECPACAETSVPPGRARWGQFFVRSLGSRATMIVPSAFTPAEKRRVRAAGRHALCCRLTTFSLRYRTRPRASLIRRRASPWTRSRAASTASRAGRPSASRRAASSKSSAALRLPCCNRARPRK